jgi:hypothetical protein
MSKPTKFLISPCVAFLAMTWIRANTAEVSQLNSISYLYSLNLLYYFAFLTWRLSFVEFNPFYDSFRLSWYGSNITSRTTRSGWVKQLEIAWGSDLFHLQFDLHHFYSSGWLIMPRDTNNPNRQPHQIFY